MSSAGRPKHCTEAPDSRKTSLDADLRTAQGRVEVRFDARLLDGLEDMTLSLPDFDLDLIANVAPIGGFSALVARSVSMQIGAEEVRVMALDDLIRVKEFLRRLKDIEALRYFYAIRDQQGGAAP